MLFRRVLRRHLVKALVKTKLLRRVLRRVLGVSWKALRRCLEVRNTPSSGTVCNGAGPI